MDGRRAAWQKGGPRAIQSITTQAAFSSPPTLDTPQTSETRHEQRAFCALGYILTMFLHSLKKVDKFIYQRFGRIHVPEIIMFTRTPRFHRKRHKVDAIIVGSV